MALEDRLTHLLGDCLLKGLRSPNKGIYSRKNRLGWERKNQQENKRSHFCTISTGLFRSSDHLTEAWTSVTQQEQSETFSGFSGELGFWMIQDPRRMEVRGVAIATEGAVGITSSSDSFAKP